MGSTRLSPLMLIISMLIGMVALWAGAAPILGPFDTELEAAQARDKKALDLFGEFAWLNFPLDAPVPPANEKGGT